MYCSALLAAPARDPPSPRRALAVVTVNDDIRRQYPSAGSFALSIPLHRRGRSHHNLRIWNIRRAAGLHYHSRHGRWRRGTQHPRIGPSRRCYLRIHRRRWKSHGLYQKCRVRKKRDGMRRRLKVGMRLLTLVSTVPKIAVRGHLFFPSFRRDYPSARTPWVTFRRGRRPCSPRSRLRHMIVLSRLPQLRALALPAPWHPQCTPGGPVSPA